MTFREALKGFEIVNEYVGKLDSYLGGGMDRGKLCLYVDDYELYHRMFVKPYVSWGDLRRCLTSVGFRIGFRNALKNVVIVYVGEDHLCLATFGMFSGVAPLIGCVCDYTVKTGRTFCLRRQNTGTVWTTPSFVNELEMLNAFVLAVRANSIWYANVKKLEGLLNAVQKDLSEWWGASE